MDGAAGPSGLDVSSWKKLCTCFNDASDTLCDALSAVARRLATTLNQICLDAFTACRLIAMDKHPVCIVCFPFLCLCQLSIIIL